MQLKRKVLGTSTLVLAVTLAGCGGDLVSVKGVVTIDGQPLGTGNISFHPVDGGPVGHGAIQSDGSFTIRTATEKGLAPGAYRVTVVATGEAPEPTPQNPEPIPQLLVPPRYGKPETSGLEYTVPSSGSLEVELRGDL